MSSPKIGRKQSPVPDAAQQFIPSYPGEAADTDASAVELAQRELEKTELMASLSAQARKFDGPIAPSRVASVDEEQEVAAAEQSVEAAQQEATVVSSEMAALSQELEELKQKQHDETERLEREFQQRQADIQRRESLVRAKVEEAEQRRRILDLKHRARVLADADAAEAQAAKESRATQNAALKLRLAPLVAAVGAELQELRKVDSTPLKVIAAKNARHDWGQRTRIRWHDDVQRPARELLEMIIGSRTYFKGLIESAEQMIARGHQSDSGFPREVNTMARDLGRCIGRTSYVLRQLAEISAKAETFDHLFAAPLPATPVEVDYGRMQAREESLPPGGRPVRRLEVRWRGRCAGAERAPWRLRRGR